MTTIAHKDGIIAIDGRVAGGDVIVTDQDDKRREERGQVFFMAGEKADEDFFKAYFGDKYFLGTVGGFVVTEGELYLYGVEDGRIFKNPCPDPWAEGTGKGFALGAMDAGASAAQAVSIAIGRDVFSGGAVRTYCAKTGNML